MADFETSLQITLANEGGYVRAEDDLSGGETYKGVSRNNWPGWSGWAIVDKLKSNINFPQNLEFDFDLQDAVKSFYQANFWNQIKGDSIGDQKIADLLFDSAVNIGSKTAVILAQRACLVTDDGIIGKDTIAALNSQNTHDFMNAFAVAKISYYLEIVKKKPGQIKYLVGWVDRTLRSIK